MYGKYGTIINIIESIDWYYWPIIDYYETELLADTAAKIISKFLDITFHGLKLESKELCQN